MYRAAALGLLALTAFASGTALAYTADELAAKNVAAKGGAEKLAAIHSLKTSGKVLVNGGAIELKYTVLVRQPGVIRLEAQLQGLTQVQAYDGHTAWQINPFQGRKDPEQLSADDAKGLAEDAAEFAGPLVGYKAKGYTLDYLGTEDVDGTEAHKLRVTRPNGDITYVYLDPDYFLEIRAVNRRIEHGVPHETVTDYGDYEKVEGVYLAFSQESGPKGSSDREKVQIEKAEVNIEAPDSQFRMPGAAQ
jgi:hypothetical protein